MRKLQCIILFGILNSIPLFAQAPPPDGVPLDPVSWVLLSAASVIGGKKYYDARKGRREV